MFVKVAENKQKKNFRKTKFMQLTSLYERKSFA